MGPPTFRDMWPSRILFPSPASTFASLGMVGLKWPEAVLTRMLSTVPKMVTVTSLESGHSPRGTKATMGLGEER